MSDSTKKGDKERCLTYSITVRPDNMEKDTTEEVVAEKMPMFNGARNFKKIYARSENPVRARPCAKMHSVDFTSVADPMSGKTKRLVTTSRSTALCGRTTNKTSTSKWNNVVVLGPQQQQRVCPIRMGQRQQGDERSSDD
ncbi:hypothetical protein GN244_ATG20292 [Phytophthora infestans]|uniref:Uncharacterized protein n=1 Tax=Phytophthora infestans TaxID=4787 RepID=A0A833ST98_PHYIN|nr:hypothetical protein GN244_ATG20292 [Phytophthora infestans]